MLLLELPGGRALEISDPMAELLDRTRDEALATSAPSTVRNHLTAVYRKFGVRSRIELLELLRPR
ncbi:MAG: hypothetical protein JWM22_2674 [Frankiales bacterium]|nr:hypothetical protein [Frankiales bacterium]